MSTRIFIEKIDSYKLPAISKFIETVFSNLHLDKKLQDCNTILLKPNMLGPYSPEKAVTTHPAVVEAMIMILQTLGKEVWLGDSPGGSVPVGKIWKSTGMEELCKRYHVKMVNFSTDGLELKKIDDREYKLAQSFFKADAVINLAKYKTHSLMYYTGCVKNLYGLVPGLKKSDYHRMHPNLEEFSQVISDIYLLGKPQIVLNILDGIWGMEGEGPSSGEPRNFGILMASENGAALDWQASRMMGFNDDQVNYILNCLQKQNIKISEIITDDKWKHFTFSNVKIKKISRMIKLVQLSPEFLKDIFRKAYKYYPAFTNKCKLCGVCRDSCPVQAITISQGAVKPEINHEICIKCMCCHELCPYNAIYIHKSLLARFLVK